MHFAVVTVRDVLFHQQLTTEPLNAITTSCNIKRQPPPSYGDYPPSMGPSRNIAVFPSLHLSRRYRRRDVRRRVPAQDRMFKSFHPQVCYACCGRRSLDYHHSGMARSSRSEYFLFPALDTKINSSSYRRRGNTAAITTLYMPSLTARQACAGRMASLISTSKDEQILCFHTNSTS